MPAFYCIFTISISCQRTFRTILADIDFFPSGNQFFPKLIVRPAPPDGGKRLLSDLSHLVSGILIKTAGDNASVPRYHTGMP
jgi:hypothetical protein